MAEPTSEVLRRVRARLSDPARWTQGTEARNAMGRHVDPEDPDATCWCMLGAVKVEVGAGIGCDEEASRRFYEAKAVLRAHGGDVVTFNDAGTHADVLALLDRAIAAPEVTP